MITMKAVAWHDIDEVWPLMEKYVQTAVDHSKGTLTNDSIRAAIRERDMQALVAVDEDDKIVGTVITEVHRAVSDLSYLYVVVVAGDRFNDWRMQANELLKKWALSMDAPYILTNGRRGLIKRLADMGWREDSVVMSLDLRN